jgi:hypothetical protein
MDRVRANWHLAQPSAEDNWAPWVMVVTGNNGLALAHGELAVRLSPLEPMHWSSLALAELGGGSIERGRTAMEEGRRMAGDHPFFRHTESALAALAGDRDHFIRVGLIPADLAAALQRDPAEAAAMLRAHVQTHLQSGERPAWRYLWLLHELGDRQLSRELVRRIDALPAGPAILMNQVFVWGRHTTFDVADAPNFSARLREAGADPAALPVLPRVGVLERRR